MKLLQHFSSSKGNLYEIIASNGKRLLLDPGVTWKRIQKALNFDISNIEGVLASQSHKDHLCEPYKLLQNGFDLYASKETFEANDLLGSADRRCHIVEDRRRIKIGDTFQVFPFALLHDTPCLGFIIHADKEDMLFVMETFYIEQRFANAFSIIAIECNFDEDVLQTWVNTGDINEELAKRIRQNHQSKQAAIDYIDKYCDISKCRVIHLLHLSGDNLNKEETRKEVEETFFIKTIVCNGHMKGNT